MALQKKKYRSALNRSRGGVPGKCLDTGAITNGKAVKDYSRNVRSFHGSNCDATQETLHKAILRKKTYG